MITDYVISCGTTTFPSFILRDEPEEKQQVDLEDYFLTTYSVFSKRLKRFADLSRTPDIREEQELLPLLHTLINTKEMIRLDERIKEKKGKGK